MDVNIVLFDDFETLDAFGPAEVFGKLPEHFHLRYLSVSGDVINSTQGGKVWTDFLIPEEIEGILLVPGGKGARRLLWKDERTLNLSNIMPAIEGNLSFYGKKGFVVQVCDTVSLFCIRN